jgi:Tfp pilus assembly protein PilE
MTFLLRTQRGITLVEVLSVLTILSLIGTIIWSVFFQGLSFSKKAETKNMLQQEANLITTNLTKIHQTSTKYEIENTTDTNNHKSEGCKIIKVSYTKNKENSNMPPFDQTLTPFDKAGICYSTDVKRVVEPLGSDNTLNILVKVWDQNDPSNFVQINAFLYRLK